MEEKVFTQKEVTEIQASILNELKLIYDLAYNAFILNCMNKNTKDINQIIINKIANLSKDIKKEASRFGN